MDVTRSLARQSLLVAAVAAVLDGSQMVMCGAFGLAPVLATILLVATVGADLALAAPASTAAVVAVVQVLVKVSVAAFAHHYAITARVFDVGYLVAGYQAGAWLGGTVAMATLLWLVGGSVAVNLVAGTHPPVRLVIVALGAGLVPWLVGRYTAARGAYIAELEQRERLRQQEQRAALDRALADEREAIARDLHDVISHHVSAIGIHAGVARMALSRTDTEAAGRSVTAVESSSRAAMVDLRRQLDLLHGRDDDGQRQPGLADIEDLVQRVRDAGLTVRVTVSGEPPVLPGSLDVMLYRVVQELLTNALRHGRDSADLEIGYRPGRVEIRESNPIGTAVVTEIGHRGLDGIRRRIELFDGSVTYGADPAGTRWEIGVSVPIGTA
ncbi:sensor histidine kinase [Nocardia seriolae]|uniref:histidine kinase n=1 Tax=Nocardia seriolae TaxID=37332 RepID=A0A0B8NGV8_9NOCA|nr:histidine kinase [Nocardia seriolae]APA96023.1 Histidine kinase [Nocardia seriolae]MTJ65885.1 two-component sensor histidine kinase [Nocardia seriolae]MTJ76071.1 two-component sensor histidine kinase [Nocardia seriolae]MTJ86186.1 two-component sensor histidine kinase [Nocardia seriolae]MTK30182.1 two-component sensor histidine kinase [Nocardia seriolae]